MSDPRFVRYTDEGSTPITICGRTASLADARKVKRELDVALEHFRCAQRKNRFGQEVRCFNTGTVFISPDWYCAKCAKEPRGDNR